MGRLMAMNRSFSPHPNPVVGLKALPWAKLSHPVGAWHLLGGQALKRRHIVALPARSRAQSSARCPSRAVCANAVSGRHRSPPRTFPPNPSGPYTCGRPDMCSPEACEALSLSIAASAPASAASPETGRAARSDTSRRRMQCRRSGADISCSATSLTPES